MWSNPSGGNWALPSNWSLNVVPTSNDNVIVSAPGDYIIDIGSYAEAASLQVLNAEAHINLGAASTLRILGELRLAGTWPTARVEGLGDLIVNKTKQVIPVTGKTSVSLAWDPSVPVEGYVLYYGPSTRSYNSRIILGNTTVASVHGLVPGVTNYFAAATYDEFGVQSEWSEELAYAAPNIAPTLDPIPDIVVQLNSGANTVILSGIGPGPSEEHQQVTVTAAPDATALITSISLNYTSPSSNAVLVFTTAPSSFGEGLVTVTVDDGISTFRRTFRVIVCPEHLPSRGIRWIIAQNSETQSLDLASAFTGGTGQMLPDYSVVMGRPSQPGLLSNIYFDQTLPQGRTRLNVTPAFDAVGWVTAYLSFTDQALALFLSRPRSLSTL
jgi:hypothetical protein